MPRVKKPTAEKILDAAERLFAQSGFDGVTVRQIMGAAGADVALAYYHFKSKRDIFDAVMMRRVEVLNQARLRELEKVERAHGDDPATVEEIIAAFVQPLLTILGSDEKKWRHYFALIAQINNSTAWGLPLMTQYFDPIVLRFIEALRRAMPQFDETDLFWCYHFMTGALTHTFAQTGRIDNLSKGLCDSADMPAIAARLPKFIAAGFRAFEEGKKKEKKVVRANKKVSSRK